VSLRPKDILRHLDRMTLHHLRSNHSRPRSLWLIMYMLVCYSPFQFFNDHKNIANLTYIDYMVYLHQQWTTCGPDEPSSRVLRNWLPVENFGAPPSTRSQKLIRMRDILYVFFDWWNRLLFQSIVWTVCQRLEYIWPLIASRRRPGCCALVIRWCAAPQTWTPRNSICNSSLCLYDDGNVVMICKHRICAWTLLRAQCEGSLIVAGSMHS
jgi:hypothetical protein